MRKLSLLYVVMLALLAPMVMAQNGDYPLLSQGILEPPPPPPGYADYANPQAQQPVFSPQVATELPAMPSAPRPSAVEPSLPMLPPVHLPASDNAVETLQAQGKPAKVKVVQAISKDLYEQLKHMMRSIYTFRTVVQKPESGEELRRILNLGRICSDLLELSRYPVPTRFSPSANDKVLRDRSYEAVEFRHFGEFDQRLNGWIKPIDSAVYLDLVFTGRGLRRTHVRAQVSRNGTLDGHFYAYSWDKYGHNWKLQGTMSNLLSFDNGLPYSGELKIFGADPAGKTMGLSLQFPVKVTGVLEPQRKEIRHRYGQPVSISK